MKTSHLLLILSCLCAQSATAQHAVTPAGDNPAGDKQSQAAELALQADDKLHAASSPQNYQEAAALLEKSVELDPGNPDVRQTLGWVYLDCLHEPHQAYPHLVRLVKLRPDDVDARKLLGMACLQTGRPQGAVEEFRAATKLEPDDPWVRASLARSLARTGKFSEAQAIYTEILKSDPANVDARLGEAELSAWRGHTAAPLQTLDQLAVENPTNADILTLRGDVHRWNWDLAEARQDYQHVLDIWPDNYDAKTGLEEADQMGASQIGVDAYQFKDTAHFLREYLQVDGRVHLTDRAYLIGDVAGWRFTSPGFNDLNSRDGAAGMEFHFARWLEAAAEATVFDYDQPDSVAFVGAKLSTKISPLPGTDIYLNGAYNQPFISSIATVEGAMRQHSVGAGLDTRLVGPLSFQLDAQGAKLSDDNKWYEIKPQLSWRLFEKPETFLRVQYDYLNYTRTNANYWTPQHRNTVGPILDTSIPVYKGFHLVGDAQAPFVFDESRFGYVVQGGPEIDLFNHLQAKASYYYSSIPGDQGAWSGHGWQASLRVSF
jgi:tetratricopeptide (TPR) repeat protein